MTRSRLDSTRRLVWLCLLLPVSGAAYADTPGAFAHIEPWPSSLSLAGIPEALGNGVEAVLENPTGMLTDPVRGVAVSHASLFSGGLVRHQAAALCWTRHREEYEYQGGEVSPKRGEIRSAYGLGVANLSGDLPGDDSYGELEIALSYARPVAYGLQSGLRIRLLQTRSSVDGTDGGGAALDFGLEERWGLWRVGALIRSLASEIRWDRSVDSPLPRGYDVGIARRLLGQLDLLVGGALREDFEPRRIAAGVAWEPSELPIRLRIAPAWRDTKDETYTELSAGAGLRIRSLVFDYGFRSGPPGLGEIHRFGLRASLP